MRHPDDLIEIMTGGACLPGSDHVFHAECRGRGIPAERATYWDPGHPRYVEDAELRIYAGPSTAPDLNPIRFICEEDLLALARTDDERDAMSDLWTDCEGTLDQAWDRICTHPWSDWED